MHGMRVSRLAVAVAFVTAALWVCEGAVPGAAVRARAVRKPRSALEAAPQVAPHGLEPPRSVVDGYDDKDGSLTNMCECECCYSIAPGRQECYESSSLLFEVGTCGKCDARSCADHFSHVCSASSSLVRAVCIERRALLVRIVPMLFVFATVSLILFGFFTRKSGSENVYTEIRESRPTTSPSSLRTLQSVDKMPVSRPVSPFRLSRESTPPPLPRSNVEGSQVGSAGVKLVDAIGSPEDQRQTTTYGSADGEQRRLFQPSPLSSSAATFTGASGPSAATPPKADNF